MASLGYSTKSEKAIIFSKIRDFITGLSPKGVKPLKTIPPMFKSAVTAIFLNDQLNIMMTSIANNF